MDHPQPLSAAETALSPVPKMTVDISSTNTEIRAKNICGSTHFDNSHVKTPSQSITTQNLEQLHTHQELRGETLLDLDEKADGATMNENHSSPTISGNEHSTLSAPVTTTAAITDNTSAAEATTSTGGDTLTLIREDLAAGHFNIPDINGQHIDHESPPPGTYRFPRASSPYYESLHRRRFSRTHLLPDSSLPFNSQVMEHVKDWAQLASTIQDEAKRKEVLDHVFEVLQKVWFEALRIGYDPGAISDNGLPPVTRAKPRKEIDPMKTPIFISRSYKQSELWAVTAGELEEAGVSENRVRRRAAGDLDLGDALLQEVLVDCEGVISKEDWYAVMERSELNPTGRSLFLYALFEVQWSRYSLEKLQKLYKKFHTRQQKENTQKRIDAEQERHDLFMALALEVNERTGSSRSPSPTPNQDRPKEVIEVDQNSDPHATLSAESGPDDVDIDTTELSTTPGLMSNEAESTAVLHITVGSDSGAASPTDLKRPLSLEVAEEKELLPLTKKLKSLESHPDTSRDVSIMSEKLDPTRQPVYPPHEGLAQEDQGFRRSTRKQSKKQLCLVTLHIPGGFNPADFSSEKVFSYKGFDYRYTRSSTLTQRRSMDEALHNYVQSWIKPQKGLDLTWRFGKYEALGGPHDDERKTVIHGFWDNKDGSKVEGAEWFYEGDGEWQPSVEVEAQQPMARGFIDDGDDDVLEEEEEEDAPAVPKITLVNKHLKNAIQERRSHGKRKTRNSGKKSKEKSKKRGRVGSLPAPSPLSQTVSSATSSSNKNSRSSRRATRSARKSSDGSDEDWHPD
ncbi:hypothetical protein LTR10_019391 [Elasticomyces elasticus]|uniref:Uncharacterized protein n=1 Tax=Exophiala sideris TaxID=1016849 RepID=A0ABR0IVD5_9EURO|nr:hypothetical protein LTR10_019391 [Elasticomyces elasticus]KAK5021432.1 hypothetical protein LTS07_011042 [Exophiala sideris]KAK5025430.1 hypothetical protein LTR13_010507 [Exophiala sideris]KAK5049281.1 hypothetical protein LTR69_011066 [Exophiala sideris]KAK5176954.1 hypothetical protein LTR44_010527 [Eurotiomycetes sp. CCFEE 6388]